MPTWGWRMTDVARSSGRLIPGLAVLAATLCLFGSGPARAQSLERSVAADMEVFVDVVRNCLDWLDADAPDGDPFKSGAAAGEWQHINTFPAVGPANPDVAVGGYVLRGGYFRIELTRRENIILCNGEGYGKLPDDVRNALHGWAADEAADGRLQIISEELTPEYGLQARVCAGGGGELSIAEAKGVSTKFYSSLEREPLSKGKCDA